MAHIVVGTAGHIDHGKSTLVQALTGTDPDRLKEEKARGITIELGFAHLALGDTTVAFVDVPGHERFVRTMLAGVGGIDCVMLIVAADESVMPQTREHFDICRLLQVPAGFVVLTKADLVDEETLALVRLEVRDLVAGSFLEHAPVLPVSARTGQGLDALRGALADAAQAVAARPATGAARLPIDRVFSMQGFGTVVTGTLVSGQIGVEAELAIAPGGRRVRVRGVQVHGRKQASADAGHRAAVNLGGVEVAEVERGATLAAPGSLTDARRVDVELDLLPGARPLRHGARVRFHQGTIEVLGRVSLAGDLAELGAGARAFARLRLEAPAALTRGDRFILRAYSPPLTIGGGRVLDPDPPRVGVRRPRGLERFRALAPAGGAEALGALAQLVADGGLKGLSADALTSRGGVPPERVADVVQALVAGGLALDAGERLVPPGPLEARSAALLELVRAHHQAQPLADGLPREEARERLFARAHPAVFELALARLAAANALVVRDRLALPGHRLALSPEEARVRDAVEAAFRDAGLRPLEPAALASERGLPAAVVEKMAALLLRQKVLVRLGALTFHGEALEGLKRDIAALKAEAAGRATVDVATFKERFGVTRKYAIPLLEWLDRERVTRRMGDVRVVL